ncbi:MAG TPA: DNA polymerase III subunit chi [Pseudomonadales bacterium]|nr:DNA polymerase III subunit chi [Pseudomonadales bacterium]
MTRIDFYVIPEIRRDARERFATRLAARAFREGRRSVILVSDDATGVRLDELLWNLPGAFLPHARLGAAETPAALPVTLGTAAELDAREQAGEAAHDLLINLTDAVPAHFASFDRVAEIVCQDDDVRAATRESYRFYRERGYPLHHHDLARERSS